MDYSDVLMYSKCNEGKSVIPERFIRAMKAKIYQKMAGNDSKFYLIYLNKLVDQCWNNYHTINKNHINAGFSALNNKKKMTRIIKLLNLKFVIESESQSIKLSVYFYTENWSREIFAFNSLSKTNLWTYKIKY